MTQLRSVTCHMGSLSVTCYQTQVNTVTPRLNPSRYSIYLPRRDGRLSWPSWLHRAPAGSRNSDLSITSPTLNQCNHQDDNSDYATVYGLHNGIRQIAACTVHLFADIVVHIIAVHCSFQLRPYRWLLLSGAVAAAAACCTGYCRVRFRVKTAIIGSRLTAAIAEIANLPRRHASWSGDFAVV